MRLLKKYRNDSAAASFEQGLGLESTTGAAGRRPARKVWRVVLPSLLFIFVALMFAAHSLARRHSNADAEYVGSMNELKLPSQQVARDAQSAVLGGVQGLAERASAMTRTMSAIRTITTQTRAGASTTATSVGKLADLAEALRTSVAGFRLPDSFDPNVVDLYPMPSIREEPRAAKPEVSEEQASDVRTV
jgi:hypothetical protein